MNAVSGTDQPPEGTVSASRASRRTFLKGVGLAGAAGVVGAAGLTGPLLERTSARAATFRNVITLGVQAPDPWNSPQGKTFQEVVAGATGCREYRPMPFTTVEDSQNPLALGNPPTFPGEAGASVVVASIRPDPAALLNGSLDSVLTQFLKDGASRFSAPRLTLWHEAGHLYQSSDFSQYGLQPLNPDGTRNAAAAQTARSMHAYMQNLCRTVGGVLYGCIIYGDIDLMANINDQRDGNNWVPTADYPLDWYGIDVYYEGDGKTSDCTHGNLDAAGVNNYLNGYLQVVKNRAPGAPINICECNADAADANSRPDFFKNLASWLDNNVFFPSMLTFFPSGGGPHSVPWNPPSSPDQGTIDALNYIQTSYG